MTDVLSTMKDNLRRSQQDLLSMLDQATDEALYQKHDQENWSFAVMLNHLTEARLYVTQDAEKVVKSPGAKIGRPADEEHRIEAIQAAQTQRIPREELRRKLVDTHATMIKFIDSIDDSDLQKPCDHVRFGQITLGDLLQRSYVEHDQAHIQQAQSVMKSV